MSTKYIEAMTVLSKINEGTKPPQASKQLVKILTLKGYIQRIIGYKQNKYTITEKGADTLEEYNKIRKILEKTRGGSHPSTGHQDQSRPE